MKIYVFLFGALAAFFAYSGIREAKAQLLSEDEFFQMQQPPVDVSEVIIANATDTWMSIRVVIDDVRPPTVLNIPMLRAGEMQALRLPRPVPGEYISVSAWHPTDHFDIRMIAHPDPAKKVYRVQSLVEDGPVPDDE